MTASMATSLSKAGEMETFSEGFQLACFILRVSFQNMCIETMHLSTRKQASKALLSPSYGMFSFFFLSRQYERPYALSLSAAHEYFLVLLSFSDRL